MSQKRGFTLVELLVVISIIALLVAMLLPALSKAREQGKNVVCQSNFHQIYLGAFMWSDDNDDWALPAVWDRDPLDPFNDFRPHKLAPLLSAEEGKDIFECPASKDSGDLTEVIDYIKIVNSYGIKALGVPVTIAVATGAPIMCFITTTATPRCRRFVTRTARSISWTAFRG